MSQDGWTQALQHDAGTPTHTPTTPISGRFAGVRRCHQNALTCAGRSLVATPGPRSAIWGSSCHSRPSMAAASVVAGMNPNSAVSSRSLFILIIVACSVRGAVTCRVCLSARRHLRVPRHRRTFRLNACKVNACEERVARCCTPSGPRGPVPQHYTSPTQALYDFYTLSPRLRRRAACIARWSAADAP